MTLYYTLQKPIEQVFTYLSDMQKFAEAHPVIYKLEKIDENHYLCYEKISLFSIPYRFTYTITLEKVIENETVKMFSDVQKGVYLHLHFALKTTNNVTEIIEMVEIKANPIIKAIFQQMLKRIHKQWFNNIELK